MKKNSNIKTILRYAQALYESFNNTKDLDKCYNEAEGMISIVQDNLENLETLNNPLWNLQKKYDIIDTMGQRLNLHANIVNMIKILVQNRHINLLPQVIAQFMHLYQDTHDIADIEVTTVIPLTARQDNLLKSKLSAIFNKKIIIKYIIDPQIIGGLVIKYGTHFIDASVRHKLCALENYMKGKK